MCVCVRISSEVNILQMVFVSSVSKDLRDDTDKEDVVCNRGKRESHILQYEVFILQLYI